MDLNEAMMMLSKKDTPPSDTTIEKEDQGEINHSAAVETPETTTEAGTETEVAKEDTPPSDTPPETYEVPYNGETLKVTIDELKKGYMREADYQYKRGEDAKLAKATQAKLDELNEKLTQVEVELQLESDWFDSGEAKELRELDPDAYLLRFEKAQNKVRSYQEAKAVRDKERNERRQLKAKEESDKLFTAIPDWIDQGLRTKEAQDAVKTLQKYGFNESEINDFGGAIDHRHLWMARQLARLEAVQAQDPTQKKVNTAPKSSTPESPSSKEQIGQKKYRDNMAKLKKTGRIEDALALF
jgi:hypothetical protein